MNKIKQVIVIRKDLNMRKGKMVAQGAHASINAILKAAYQNEYGITIETKDIFAGNSTEIGQWLETDYTKIVLSVNSEKELLDLNDAVIKAGLNCALVQDNGLTEFNGVKTWTALAIGPDFSNKIDLLTSNLSLL